MVALKLNVFTIGFKFSFQAILMIRDILFNKTGIPAALKSLDAAMLRSRTIANNIANVNTPGYQRVEISFENQLRSALKKSSVQGAVTQSGHIPLGRKDLDKVQPKAYKPIDPTLPSGVNNVDIDTEMSKLAENQLLFSFGARAIKERLKTLDGAIKGRSINMQ